MLPTTGPPIRAARRLTAVLALALLLAACGMPVEEEQQATPGPGVTVERAGRPVTVVRPTPGTPAPSVEPVTPSSSELPTCYQPTPDEPAIEGTPVEPSERIASPDPVPTPPYYEPLPLEEDPALEAQLREVLGDDVDAYGVVVKSLEDGHGALINADKFFYAASLFKVTVMLEVHHQRSLGLLSFDEPLLVTPYYAGFDLGTLSVGVCETVTIGEALAHMMSVSDNVSAVLLQDRVGSANINRSMEVLGLETTRLLADDLPTTAADMALLLEAIARPDAETLRPTPEATPAPPLEGQEASQEMVNLLASEEIDNGLREGVPQGTLVAHKTGNWSNATHDAGIVYSPGATYVIAVLSETDHETRLTTEVSGAVWEYYNGAAGSEEGE